MMDWIGVPLALLIIFGTLYKTVALFARRTERIRLIEKIGTVDHADLGQLLNGQNGRSRYTPLRIGLLLLGVGTGLLVALLIDLYLIGSVRVGTGTVDPESRSIVDGACICVFGGLALLLSYLIENRQQDKKKEGE